MVVKRNGSFQQFNSEKVLKRLNLAKRELNFVNTNLVKNKLESNEIQENILTTEIDTMLAEIAASMSLTHPEYGQLAANIAISCLQKETPKTFSETIKLLDEANIMNPEIIKSFKKYPNIDSWIDNERDFLFDYIAIKTLMKSHLLKLRCRIIERPQYMFLRVALAIHGEKENDVRTAYELMSKHFFTHATPTLFNAGTQKQQMSSCFQLTIAEDSIPAIFKAVSNCAMISQHAGGIGIAFHNIRSSGSFISGMGMSKGTIPFIKVLNETVKCVNQGGKRKGAAAVYLELWHADILEYLNLKRNIGPEDSKARDLHYGVWVPDLFMKRVENKEMWSLFSPSECQQLYTLWGEEFELAYLELESKNVASSTILAETLFQRIIRAQIETGNPFILYKDSINAKSNQQHLGTIQSANLCTEIVQYTSADEIAVCNLASICLPKFVENGQFDHSKFCETVKFVVKSLNRVIDVNFYTLKEARHSNTKHRPIGVGVQGLADVFFLLKLPFASPEAKKLNYEIFETLYFAAVSESVNEAKMYGPYDSFAGSPYSKGLLQFDLWGTKIVSNRWPWDSLKDQIKQHGLRNTYLTALMPTATTARLMGNTESFEPIMSNAFVSRNISGEFININKYLVQDLTSLNLWTKETVQELIRFEGSVQNLNIPQTIKDLYKTIWEIPSEDLIDMSASRGVFIDQSQSLSFCVSKPTHNEISTILFDGWKRGLKTGMYYLRTQSAYNAAKVTIPVCNSCTS